MEYDIRNFYKKIDVLDHGSVELIDGPRECPKLKIVNAARVSFDKESRELKPRDIKLIDFLYKHEHFSTFRHSHFSFRIKAPILVFRQWWKYQVGSSWEEKDELSNSIIINETSWNEMSLRYVEAAPEFYIPNEIRLQSKDNKQGSYGKLEKLSNGLDPVEFYRDGCLEAYERYSYLVSQGAAKEQCRGILPMNVYSQCIWTISLQTAIFFLHQRLKEDAQYEIRQYALGIHDLLVPIFSPLELF